MQGVDGPGDGDGGGLVAGDDEEEELLADLLITHRSALFVAGVDEQAEHVVARRVLARFGDPPIKGGEELAAAPREGGVRADAAELAAQGREKDDEWRDAIDEAVEALGELGHGRRIVDAEDGAEDDVEGDPLGEVVDGDGLSFAPCRGGSGAAIEDGAAVGAHARALEGRGEESAEAAVRGAADEDERAAAEEELHVVDVRGEGVRISAVDLLDASRVAGDYERRGAREGEGVAVAPRGSRTPADRIAEIGGHREEEAARARRERGRHGGESSLYDETGGGGGVGRLGRVPSGARGGAPLVSAGRGLRCRGRSWLDGGDRPANLSKVEDTHGAASV
jgi:hypothetical protein